MSAVPTLRLQGFNGRCHKQRVCCDDLQRCFAAQEVEAFPFLAAAAAATGWFGVNIEARAVIPATPVES